LRRTAAHEFHPEPLTEPEGSRLAIPLEMPELVFEFDEIAAIVAYLKVIQEPRNYRES